MNSPYTPLSPWMFSLVCPIYISYEYDIISCILYDEFLLGSDFMKKIRFLIPYAAAFVLCLLVLFGFYMAVSAGLPNKTIFLQLRRYAVCALLLSIAITCWKQSGRSYTQLISHAIVGLSWMIVYPWTYWLTYHQNTHFIDNHFDIAMGVYLFLFSTSLSQLLYHTTKISKLSLIHI